MSDNKIPSEADFARAKSAMRHRDRGLEEVRSSILTHFRTDGVHEIIPIYSSEHNLFVIHLFYELERQIGENEESGLTERIKQAVIEELERVGRGKACDLKVEFEIDSHEEVERNYEGDYYLRLR